MLKMYQQRQTSGDSAAFWELNWHEDTLAEAIRFCTIDPLRPFFERHAPVGSRMLEGGCGQGQYVVFYAARGVKVVGLDFAQETLARLHRTEASLALCGGNVAALPFRSSTFDVYYSGGVVEHFEAGPEAALREARRVLRQDGVLLVSVPYFSPLRHALLPFRRTVWKRVRKAEVDGGVAFDGRSFWQYAYTQREFCGLLQHAGFRVIARQGYSILWGLYDLPLVAPAVAALERRRHQRVAPACNTSSEAQAPLSAADTAPATQERTSLLKRLVVGEDGSVAVAGWVVRALRSTCANMMMYVCTR